MGLFVVLYGRNCLSLLQYISCVHGLIFDWGLTSYVFELLLFPSFVFRIFEFALTLAYWITSVYTLFGFYGGKKGRHNC
ncbi:hypothetical protein I7I53_03971 [Histoplasma capsulatum var. duboisii H88]|uniref:Uncharacterized protein n=1 Tax=Ajellomyces capsulatus (strain H88) TaxID=544711 RepID=A0A8A1LU44_AJEC8|nr:hypothetical protein I7I53_03971 [Histoplasma capsulatum var. duboisii H88]